MSIKQRRIQFQNPGSEYRGKPFWSWNGELKKEEIVRQIHIMKEMGFGGYFMHSRFGLITEYLGEEWFELINVGADTGKELELEAWLYDEDRWPSGSAGGMVTVDKKYRMKSIQVKEVLPEKFNSNGEEKLLFVAKMEGINVHFYRKIENATEIDLAIEELGAIVQDLPGIWKVLAFYIVEDECTSEYNGTTYIDTMSRAATERFIELTHEKYLEKCGDRIGTSIKGVFTDEPCRGKGMGDYKEEDGVITCSMAWTDDLFEEFLLRYGYDAQEVLPELFYRLKGERFAPIKHDYFDLADNLFLERFAMPLYEWCQEHGLHFTGHVLHEDSLACQAAPHGSIMRFYEYMDYPGVDVLRADNYAYWVVKQLSSIARQLGKKWCLSELYGCTGWELSMKGQKRIGDWQTLLGINLRCHHLSWYTMEGEAKRDYPGSMLHQAAWYPYYAGVESYFARFGYFMSEGRPECDVLVLNPVESVWSQCYAGWTDWIFSKSEEVNRLEVMYMRLFHMLMNNHIDFDYGEEQLMEKYSGVGLDENGFPTLSVGEGHYHVVVVGGMETIRPNTLRILEEFIDLGGKVVFAGEVPAYVNAFHSEEPKRVSEKACRVEFDTEAVVREVRAGSHYDVKVIRESGESETEVFIQMRDWGGSHGLALLNLNNGVAKDVQVVCKAEANAHIECWDLETGACYNADSIMRQNGETIIIKLHLLPAESKAFVITTKTDDSLLQMNQRYAHGEAISVHGKYEYRLAEDNVCVLDKACWRLADGEWSNVDEVLKIDRRIRENFGLEYRSGDMLQPWYTKKYHNDRCGAIELQYEFEVEDMPKETIYLVGERPETMQYAINGVALSWNQSNGFWIDDCFKKMEIPKDVLKKGKNIITVQTAFSALTNVEAIYLVGKFGVVAGTDINKLTVLPDRIGSQNLSQYHLPFYTGEITYYVTPEMYQDIGLQAGEQIYLLPKSEYASLYKVKTSEGEQILYWDPYEANVSKAIAQKEVIEVTIVASRRNTFGPLHLKPAIQGGYGPFSYMTEGEAWSDSYELLDNGLQIFLKKH